MTAPKLLYLDANIFIEMIEVASARTFHLRDLLSANDGSRPPNLVTSELTLAEVLVKPYSNANAGFIQDYESMLTNGGPLLIVAPANRDVMKGAAALRGKYPSLKLPYAIHISTAFEFDCTHFLSADQRLALNYESPSALASVSLMSKSIQLLRPEPDVISQLITEFSV